MLQMLQMLPVNAANASFAVLQHVQSIVTLSIYHSSALEITRRGESRFRDELYQPRAYLKHLTAVAIPNISVDKNDTEDGFQCPRTC